LKVVDGISSKALAFDGSFFKAFGYFDGEKVKFR
jgi:hypothetical protein